MIEKDFLDGLEISHRARNVLRNHDITTPQLFYNLTRTYVMTLRGAGRRVWLEIEELQIIARREARQESIPGQALALIRQLNVLPLEHHGFFITHDSQKRLRLARYATMADLDRKPDLPG